MHCCVAFPEEVGKEVPTLDVRGRRAQHGGQFCSSAQPTCTEFSCVHPIVHELL